MAEATAKQYLGGVMPSRDLYSDLKDEATRLRWIPEYHRMQWLGFLSFLLIDGRHIWYPEGGSRSQGFVGTE